MRGESKHGEDSLTPVVFVPGLGMSVLNVQVLIDKDVTGFDFLLPSMYPIDILPHGALSALEYSVTSGLPREEAELVPTWMSFPIDDDGVASNQPGVSVAPVSIGRDFAAECQRYLAMTNQLAAAGCTLDANLFCLPFDYRYARGQFLRFGLHDPRGTCGVGGKWPKGGGGLPQRRCLMAYHALRVLDPTWVKANVAVLYGFAGQFSGCSDCLRWAFQSGWSCSSEDQNASPVDPSWVGELALDLQPSVYGDAVLYRNGTKEYRATDARALLQVAGAVEMSRATGAYTLEDQDWFRRGSIDGEPLPIPRRFVFGVELATTVGYAYDFVAVRTGSCQEPECAGFWSAISPSVITSDGDGGDRTLMNAAPKAWTSSPACDIRTIPGVDHKKIVTDPDAITGLVATAHGSVEGSIPCAG
jgi:hypothetical protein